MDSLTGLNDKQYLLRRMNELTSTRVRPFTPSLVYAYQLDHMNKVSGVQSGDEFLRRAAEHMQEIAGRNVFRVTGKRFLLLTFSLREYEACLTQPAAGVPHAAGRRAGRSLAGHPVRRGGRGKAGNGRSCAGLCGISRISRSTQRRD